MVKSARLFSTATSSLPFYSDKALLPQSILQDLIDAQKAGEIDELPHPLIFRLSTPSSRCYAGVREFSSQENEIVLPGLLTQKLGITNENTSETPIIVELMSDIPQATRLTLKPITKYARFSTDQDWKWFLEAKLTSLYTTLTKNDKLVISDGKETYKLNVSAVSPARTVCIVDTDIDLDLTTDQVVEETSKENEFVNIVKAGAIVAGQKAKIDTTNNFEHGMLISGDTDFALSGDRFIGPDSFLKSTVNSGIKKIVVKPDSPLLKADSVYVIMLGDAKSTLSIEVNDLETVKSLNKDEAPDENHIKCQYCGSWINRNAQFMHENFCRRNNVMCNQGCGQVFLHQIPESHWHCCNSYGNTEASLTVHKSYCHSGPVTCSLCGSNFNSREQMAYHRSSECSKQLHECRFCHLIVARGEPTAESRVMGMSAHEYECGSKTTECSRCGKVVRRRDLSSHARLHELNRISKPAPVICANQNCIRPIGNSGNLGLCQVCFGPLFSSVYDPDGSKLLARLERRYIIQLHSGCHHSWCQNRLCKTSNVGNKPDLGSFATIIKLVKTKLIPKTATERTKYYFCVDEGMTRKKAVEQALESMPEFAEYSREWICQAVEDQVHAGDSEHDIEIKVQRWLSKNGVKKSEVGSI